ncbi:hypothetical protein ACFWUZ_08555 [Streptomyces sp. NPDC058646]|uniref:hypothetical protein n=1 Tax=Streptomyces sp. NPDC058646 TaxID=3346574 RepID=UPI00365BE85E
MCAADEGAAATARARCGSSVSVISSLPVAALWMRDSGAVFRGVGAGAADAIGLNFKMIRAPGIKGRDIPTTTSTSPPGSCGPGW